MRSLSKSSAARRRRSTARKQRRMLIELLESRTLLSTYTVNKSGDVPGVAGELRTVITTINGNGDTNATVVVDLASITLTQGQITVNPAGNLLIKSGEGSTAGSTVIHGGGFFDEGGSTQLENMTVTGASGEDIYLDGTAAKPASLALTDVLVSAANDGIVTTNHTTLTLYTNTQILNCNSYGMITQGNVSIPGTGSPVQFYGNYTGWDAENDNFGGTISVTGAVFTANKVFGMEIYEGSATIGNSSFVGGGFRNISDSGTDIVTLTNDSLTSGTGSFSEIQATEDNTSTFTVNGASLTTNAISGPLVSTNGGIVNLNNLSVTGNTATEMIYLGGVGNDNLTSDSITSNHGAGVVVAQAATEVSFTGVTIENCTALAGQTAGAAVTLNGADAFFVNGALDHNTGGAIYDAGTDPDLTIMGTDMSYNTGAQGSLTVNISSGGYGGNIMAQEVMFGHDQGTGSVSAVDLTGSGAVSSFDVQQGSCLDDTNGYAVSVQLSGQGGEMVAVDQELFTGDDGAATVAGPTGQLTGLPPQFVFAENEVTANNNPQGQIYLSGLGNFVAGNNYIHGNTGDGLTIVGNSSYTIGSPGASVQVLGNTITGNSNPAGNGGGISATIGLNDAQEFANNTVYRNTALNGGGIYDQGLAPSGSGSFSGLPGINIIEDTITQNTATGSGGGIWFAAAPGWPFGTPPPAIVGAPGALSLDSSIVAQNNGPSSSPDIAGTVFEAVYSLVGNDSGTTFSNSTSTDILGTAGSPVNAGLSGPVTLPGGPGPEFEPGSLSVGSGDAGLNNNPYNFQTFTDENGVSRVGDPPTQGAVVSQAAAHKQPVNPPQSSPTLVQVPPAPTKNSVKGTSSLLVTVSSPTPISSPAIGDVLVTTGSPTKVVGATGNSSSPKTAAVITKSVAVPAGPVSFRTARVNQSLLSPMSGKLTF